MDGCELRRWPDVEGPDLVAVDAADRLLLDEAASALPGAPGELTVIDDAYGALTIGAVRAGARDIRVHQDLITGERALAANAARLGLADRFVSAPCEPGVVAGARLVLLRLPRSLDRLDEVAALIAAHCHPEVVVLAGGRIKHMTPTMNDVLATVFERVDVSHARQKSRVLTARGPRREAALTRTQRWPRTAAHPDLQVTVAAHGGVFAGTGIDLGTRFLLGVLGEAMPDATTAVDLACGSGVVAARLAVSRPGIHVLATDRSAAAAASARATAAANGVADRVTVTVADALEDIGDGAAEFVVLNPPFHSDGALSTAIAGHLFRDTARALMPGGELWCVWNSHLRYRGELERLIGPTRQIARNNRFTVTASRRR